MSTPRANVFWTTDVTVAGDSLVALRRARRARWYLLPIIVCRETRAISIHRHCRGGRIRQVAERSDTVAGPVRPVHCTAMLWQRCKQQELRRADLAAS